MYATKSNVRRVNGYNFLDRFVASAFAIKTKAEMDIFLVFRRIG
jgi:hypothetical protein